MAARKLLDTDHPFFRPLWVRLAVVAVAGGWTAFEFWMGSPIWGLLFLAFTGMSIYGFFFDFNPDEPKKPGDR